MDWYYCVSVQPEVQILSAVRKANFFQDCSSIWGPGKGEVGLSCRAFWYMDFITWSEGDAGGALEVFHRALLKNLPKRPAFSYMGMRERAHLAILEHNENMVKRKQATTKTDDETRKHSPQCTNIITCPAPACAASQHCNNAQTFKGRCSNPIQKPLLKQADFWVNFGMLKSPALPCPYGAQSFGVTLSNFIRKKLASVQHSDSTSVSIGARLPQQHHQLSPAQGSPAPLSWWPLPPLAHISIPDSIPTRLKKLSAAPTARRPSVRPRHWFLQLSAALISTWSGIGGPGLPAPMGVDDAQRGSPRLPRDALLSRRERNQRQVNFIGVALYRKIRGLSKGTRGHMLDGP
ncbi:hypothetical protein N1851_022563 [Merluccius polli]|uniref:Uncharacterized protein n=1 Tax=Merluccius polli TaxID=89951 RepID=A0AA47NVR7_MERPO|nr:hypothetical protein N1851_022563 [Merluccius polli]